MSEIDSDKIIVSEEVPIHDDEFEDKKFIAKHCRREETDDARYAIKFLRKDIIRGSRYVQGAVDLVIEAYLLSSISHPNIVKIRGISGAGVSGFASPETVGYFIIMDRLYDTLGERIETWKAMDKKQNRLRNKLTHTKKSRQKKSNTFLGDRLKVMFDIAGACQHLHSNDIIYRDLKPENVGFDIRGDAKIFDFGLATEALEQDKNDDGTYRLSANVGTPRYMAPEVATGASYNHLADVYSFGLVLYEVCHLVPIYENMTCEMHERLVIQKGARPLIDESLPPPIRSLIMKSWDGSWKSRPDFKSILTMLKLQVTLLRGGDFTGLEHKRRRSTFVRITRGSIKRAMQIKNRLSFSDS